jgi:hypothetical protein
MSCCKSGLLVAGLLLLGGGIMPGASAAQAIPGSSLAPDTARITTAIDNTRLSTVKGSKSLKALTAIDKGALSDAKPIRNMTLVLKRSADKQSRFEAYIAEQNNPSSKNYHKWLTAAQIGAMFGPARSDIDQVTKWLTSQGLTVNAVLPAGTMVSFSGSASAVNRAFHTQMHGFSANGESHFANVTDQQIPEALVPVVAGVSSLDNFFPKPQYHNVGTVSKDKQSGKWRQVAASPNFTVPPGDLNTRTIYDVAPPDFNKIYNVEPLWARSTPIRGAGQTIAVLERTDVLPQDINAFRSAFLPADAKGVVSYVNPPAQVLLGTFNPIDSTCADPGFNGDEIEAALDAEWVGAAAPDANILFASCDDSDSAQFGPFTAAANLLSNPDVPPPPVFSLSYGECEILSLTDITQLANIIWQQAAAQGVSVFVSSGDSGAAGCDHSNSPSQLGINVNSLASTPFNVSVGGTDFDDVGSEGNYWASGNLAGGLSALGYIPEQTWNNSCASGKLDALLKVGDGVATCNAPAGQPFLAAVGGGGGPSILWTQPPWQAGIYGAPQSHSRMQPDVSLFAASGLYGHALVFCMSDPNEGGNSCDYSNPDNVLFNSAGGTSFAAPALAGIQALVNQATQQSHGNVSPALYAIAAKEFGTNASPNTAMLSACNSSNGAAIGSTCVFRDVTQGDNDEPCFAGASDCFSGAASNTLGVLSHGGDISLAQAWKTGAGYDYGTGLGTINASNLVDAMVGYDQSFQKRGYTSPGDFLGPYLGVQDGYSDIALVDPVAGVFTDIAMHGSVVLQMQSQNIAKGYTIGAIGNFYPHLDDPAGIDQSLAGEFNLASLAWTGPDNQLYVWLSDGAGGQGNYLAHAVGAPFPAGWRLVGPGDFDGPAIFGGRADLLWINDGTGQIGWWELNVGFQTVQHHPELKFSNNISPLLNVAPGYVPTIVDVDGDGFADIVWTNPNDNSVYVWINNQAGDFVRHRVADHLPGFTLFGAGDINGDGKTDLIWTNPNGNQMSWWIMNGFTVVDQQVRNVAPGYTMSSLADFDGDGLADILWVGTAGDVYQWQSNGSGFQSFRVADPSGVPVVFPAGAKVQAVRMQGTPATGGVQVVPPPQSCQPPSC